MFTTLSAKLKKTDLSDLFLASLAAFTGALLAQEVWTKAVMISAGYAAARAAVSFIYLLATKK